MDLFNALHLIGGLSLFLFGMSLMGTGLEKSAGNKLKGFLERLTTKKMNGFFLGMGITAVIQSSSATTVMVVGFVNSGIMTLKQAIHVIMGANVGTTVTAWILSLAGIEGDNLLVKLLKPASFTPILALIGIIYYMFLKNDKKKDIGLILLGFATLIYGMDSMSAAVAPLGKVEGFRNALLMFSNPVLGVLVGAVFTFIIQSSSASLGILQALSSTGQVTIGTTIPIIMGQNIGTTVTALLSSIGTNKNARRAAIVHLYFNIIGTVIFLTLYSIVMYVFRPAVLGQTANHVTIAITHTAFNICCTAILLPFSGLLEKLAYKTIKDDNEQEKTLLLDTRLFSTPAIAINQSKTVAKEMAKITLAAFKQSLILIDNYDEKEALKIKEIEQQTDVYEDALGTYLVRLSGQSLSAKDTTENARLLYLIGEFERIADYSVSIVSSFQEMYDKNIYFSEFAKEELNVITAAVEEAVEIAVESFIKNDIPLATKLEPLEEVIDNLKSEMKKRHITRLQRNECTIELGFIFNDLITVLERIADHCSNIAGCIIEISHDRMDMHEYLYRVKHEPNQQFINQFNEYSEKYSMNEVAANSEG